MRRRAGNIPYFDVLLRQIDDRPSSEVVKAFGTRHVHWGYFESPRDADGSAASLVRASEALARRVCDAAAVGDGQCILDVGCGFGGTIASLNERFCRLTLTGLNIDHRQLERAKMYVCAGRGNRSGFVQGDACQIPFADNTFDVVLAVECVFHFPSRLRFFREARRVLKPNGRLALSDFVPTALMAPICAPLELLLSHSLNRYLGSYNRLPCTRSAYRLIARSTGFRTVRDEDITVNTLPTYPIVRRLLREIGLSPAAKAVKQAERFSRTGLVCYRILAFESKCGS